MEIVIYVALILTGACLGSFAGASVWRLRARQLVEDKAAGEEVDAAEYKRLAPLARKKGTADRSIDLDTGKQLPWYDLIPIVSWLALRGKSRFSGKPIGAFEFIIELAVPVFFVVSYLLWPYDLQGWMAISQFVLWLAAGVTLAILFAYDMKWFLLPNAINFTLIGIGAASATLTVLGAPELVPALMSLLGAVLILSGLYFLLYVISKGQWIGFGDIKLGLGLALLLANWELAFIALFAANLVGTLIVLPSMIRGKITRATRVPFGPMLIAGAVIAQLAGMLILDWYTGIFF